MRMKTRGVAAAALLGLLLTVAGQAQAQPIYITFVWHMHQPIYWPGEDILTTAGAGHYSFDVVTTHNDRTGPYTGWPRDAIGAARSGGLSRCGAQVSLTGSLMENLDVLEAGNAGFSGWRAPWQEATAWMTDGGNPAVDLIGFGYFHPLSALIDPRDMVLQIRLHRLALSRRFPGYTPSKGMFPPETAFSERMIPGLVEAGVEWIVVDNVHFDRTLPDYPYSSGSNLIPPNQADQRSQASVSWLELNDLWAPGHVSAPWGYQPHRARHVDPATGQASEIIVVPGARYEGNEDARGGFGALNYEAVLSQLEPHNTDADHPILVVLHHDGDNYGGGTDAYYHANFQGFVSWINANPARFQCITIEDYLALYPPDAADVIHVEDGSWSGADNGDAEFLKWNADPDTSGYSPDRNSWAVITAARNRVGTATDAQSMPSDEDVLDGLGDLGYAWRQLLMAEASDYWYWDFSESGIWDSHPTRAANMATGAVDAILSGITAETTPPTIYVPQRQAYNPGELEWGPEVEPEALSVWTYVYDVSGLARVELFYRFDSDGVMEAANHLYDGGTWCVEEMASTLVTPQTDPAPNHVADLYERTVGNLGGFLIDYYVEAEDLLGNTTRSPIQHVWVGDGGGGGGGGSGVSGYPPAPSLHDAITVVAWAPGQVHWGINGWTEPPAEYWPAGTTAFGDGQSVETPLTGPAPDGRYTAVIGPLNGTTSVSQVDWVVHYADDTWSTPDRVTPIDNAPASLPTVHLAEPADGATVQGVVRIIAAAAGDPQPPAVQFLVDGMEIGTAAARPFEADWDSSTAAPGNHTISVSVGGGVTETITVAVGGGGAGECTVTATDGGVVGSPDGGPNDPDSGWPLPDSGTTPTDDEPGGGCGCRSAGAPNGVYLVGLLLLGLLVRRRKVRLSGRLAALLLVGLLAGACGPSKDPGRDGSSHDAQFQLDASVQNDAEVTPDASEIGPDAGPTCTDTPEARTGTTIYLLDGNGQETGEPLQTGSLLTVEVRLDVVQPPVGNIGFLHLDADNLDVDLLSFTLDGQPLTLPDPFTGRIPLTLVTGTIVVAFEATVQSQLATVEVDAWLGYGSGGSCPMDVSHSLAVLQVLGGVEKGVDCYDLDQAQSVQVTPFTPLASTAQFEQENGLWSDVLIDDLVVGGPQCPGEGVLVHQIQKCFTRSAASTITLSGHAYGGVDWFVDDVFLVEVLDEQENVVAAIATWQQGTQVLGCCDSPPCDTALSYAPGGPTVLIENLIQGGGNNGDITAGSFDLTPYLPTGSAPFFLRFTALDQGVEGALDRIFLNVLFP